MKNSTIAILTDFGSADYYAGIMKGVMLKINPAINIVDLSHTIAPQNVTEAAFILYTSYGYFPEGTIFVIVVDPGVGSSRDILCVEADNRYFICPDNGVLSYLLQVSPIQKAVVLDKKEYFLDDISDTFHGRDIFSPAAAHLAKGIEPENMGRKISPAGIKKFDKPALTFEPSDVIKGEVIFIDKFGNLISSIHKNALSNIRKGNFEICIAGRKLTSLNKTFSNAEIGELLAYTGSSGFLEIAVRNGDAGKAIKAFTGMEIGVNT